MKKQTMSKNETKTRILFAAKKVFAEKGFDGARMSSIAALAGVNQALLHYYFDSKEKLYESIFHNFIGHEPEKDSEKIIDIINSWNSGPELKLCAVLYILVEIHTKYQDRDINRLMAREIADDTGIIKEIVTKYMMPRMDRIAGEINAGIDRGIFQVSNPRMLVLSLITFIHSYSDGMELLEGTSIFDRFYGHSTEFLFDFIVEHTFKALRPEGKELHIPDLDRQKRASIDMIISEIAERNNLNNNIKADQ